ncbi:MAG: hypothetical protein HRU19_06685 [Pseudobacteriovorax sp.]|nr:hypothetical protein [Pseudobacteriovorax sp.]
MKAPDFSKESTNKVVLSDTLQHPLTLGLATVGIFGGAASFLFSLGTLPALVGIGGISLAALSWIVNYVFRKDIFAARHIQKLQKMLDDHREETIKTISREFTNLREEPGLKEFCEQGTEQFTRSKIRYDNLVGILKSKISTSELTFSRYQGTAEQVYMAILDNLVQVIHSLQSIKPIDFNYINQRFTALSELNELTKADENEIATLNDRKSLRKNQTDLINQILTQNEEAMTMLDKTSLAIAQMNVGANRSDQALEHAMSDLEELAKRTTRY